MAEQLEMFPEYSKVEPEKKYINHPEWCFQFFDNEPVPFAYTKTGGGTNPLVLEISPIETEALIFQYKGMSFKIFAREMSEEAKERVKNEGQD